MSDMLLMLEAHVDEVPLKKSGMHKVLSIRTAWPFGTSFKAGYSSV